MRCQQSLKRERERLERALKATRNEMAQTLTTSTPLKLMLDEAKLIGQIEAVDYALGTAEGGWPHDALSVLQDARLQALLSMRKAGVSFESALEIINLNEAQARLLVKVSEPDTAQRN